MIVKLLTKHHLEFLSLKGGCRGSSESTHVKMPNYWKSHALAHILSLSEIRNTIPESMFMSLLGSRLSVSGLPRRLVTGRDSNDSALLALRILRLFQC